MWNLSCLREATAYSVLLPVSFLTVLCLTLPKPCCTFTTEPLALQARKFSADSAMTRHPIEQPASDCPIGAIPWPGEACQPAAEAVAAAEAFMHANIFPWDAANEATLFEGGLVGPMVNLSLSARQRFGWAARVPRAIWQDAVLPYALVNEARTDWRSLLWKELIPVVETLGNSSTLAEVATLVNLKMWAALGKFSGTEKVVFRSEQTPLVFDPMSTLLYGFASCTGISILYVDALRTLGVPARLVGTPAWHGQQLDGNHNWVEVWLGEEKAGTNLGDAWAFIEGSPAGGGESFSDACDKWFCNAAHFAPAPNATRVFATAFDRRHGALVHYPMAWDLAITQVMGVDRTEIYNAVCSRCDAATDEHI